MDWYKKAMLETITVFKQTIDQNLHDQWSYSENEGVYFSIDAKCQGFSNSWAMKIRIGLEDADELSNVTANLSGDWWQHDLSIKLSKVSLPSSYTFFEGKITAAISQFTLARRKRKMVYDLNIRVTADKEKIFNPMDAPAPNKYKKPRWGR